MKKITHKNEMPDTLAATGYAKKFLSNRVIAVRFASSCAHDILDRYERVVHDTTPRSILRVVEEWAANPTARNARAVTEAVHDNNFMSCIISLSGQIANDENTNKANHVRAMIALMTVALAAEAVYDKNYRMTALKAASAVRKMVTEETADHQLAVLERLSRTNPGAKPTRVVGDPAILTSLLQ